jgi:hypothetical protein
MMNDRVLVVRGSGQYPFEAFGEDLATANHSVAAEAARDH